MVQSDSWTVAAPFKEQKHVRTAVESIANNFSPFAQQLDIRKLPKTKSQATYPGDGFYLGGKFDFSFDRRVSLIIIESIRFVEKGKKN